MAKQDEKNASDLGEQAMALAEQLGRMAGTAQGTAEAWLTNQKLADQLVRVRDGASRMLQNMRGAMPGPRRAGKAGTRPKASTSTARKTDPAHAPGKRRRKPAPSMRGAKKSNQTIPKLRTAAAVRQRRKSYA